MASTSSTVTEICGFPVVLAACRRSHVRGFQTLKEATGRLPVSDNRPVEDVLSCLSCLVLSVT